MAEQGDENRVPQSPDMNAPSRDTRYLSLVIDPIRVCSAYKPRLGQGIQAGLNLSDFQDLYRGDPFYNWFGLDNALMYAAHKAAGGMTSIYRQIGIGCEHLFRAVLRDELGLTEDEASWSYSVRVARGKRRTLSLDGRIPIDAVRDSAARSRVEDWIHGVCRELGVNRGIVRSLTGVVFEVRQGYKSKDSKRQNVDLANAATAYSQAYLPCVALLSMQMDDDIFTRYKAAKWAMLTGRTQGGTSQDSTYHFMREVVGYDLAGFFVRHARELKAEVNRVLETLLSAT
jgi:hypothetical protein